MKNFNKRRGDFFIIAQLDSAGSIISRATSFNLDCQIIITAGHFVLDRTDSIFKIFLTPDDFHQLNGVEVEFIHAWPEIDIAVFTCLSKLLSIAPNIGCYTIPIGSEVTVCGYAAEKGNIPSSFQSDIVNDVRDIKSSIYCYEITQCKKKTITNYLGISGSPLFYKDTIIGIVLYQQKTNTLFCSSLSEIIPIISPVLDKEFNLIEENEIDYSAPACPKVPFDVVCEVNNDSPITKGLSVQFSFNKWNLNEFSKELSEWLVDYVISPNKLGEYENKPRAAIKIAEKHFIDINEKDFLDLLLHIAIRKNFKTIPIINKIFKINNENIPSCSHAVINKGKLELWLGISGYSQNIDNAISDVNSTILKLLTIDNISNRFKIITNDIKKEWPLYEKLKRLGDNSLSLDKRVDKIIVPVFICYEAEIVKNYTNEDLFLDEFNKEILKTRDDFINIYTHSFIDKIDIRLFSFPLNSFQELLDSFIEELS